LEDGQPDRLDLPLSKDFATQAKLQGDSIGGNELIKLDVEQ